MIKFITLLFQDNFLQPKTPFQNIFPLELSDKLVATGFKAPQLKKLYKYFYHNCLTPDQIRDEFEINRSLISKIQELYSFPTLKIQETLCDEEGNRKIAYVTEDGHLIETVLLVREGEASICISTQIGCKMKCAFCATGQLPFVRNLEVWEMLEQVRLIYLHFLKGKQELTHVTVMGMGEPMENFDAVYQCFLTLIHPYSYSIGIKKVSIASSGYLPGLEKLLQKKIQPTLVLSLHAPNQQIREKLLPISKKYPLEQLLDFIRRYPLKPHKRISIQYLLLDGFNDQEEHAEELGRLLKGLPVKINFMRFNEVEGLSVKSSSEEKREYFISRLRDEYGFSTIRRRSVGGEIKAACGQLGYSSMQKNRKIT